MKTDAEKLAYAIATLEAIHLGATPDSIVKIIASRALAVLGEDERNQSCLAP